MTRINPSSQPTLYAEFRDTITSIPVFGDGMRNLSHAADGLLRPTVIGTVQTYRSIGDSLNDTFRELGSVIFD